MKRSASLLVLLALACGLLGVASASTTASRRYEATGDPVLVCPVNDLRPSTQGACFPVPTDVTMARILVRDDAGAFVSFRVEFVNAAGLPADPAGAVAAVWGAIGSSGYAHCGFGSAGVPPGAVHMRVNLVAPTSFGCAAATSGLIDVEFTSFYGS